MKKLILILLILIYSCSTKKIVTNSYKANYLITEIDSLDNYYILYAKNIEDGYNYKIISEKDVGNCENLIKVGKEYLLNTESIFVLKIKENNKIVEMTNHVNIDCIILGKTKICKEYDKGIVDVYKSTNLKGLCYIND